MPFRLVQAKLNSARKQGHGTGDRQTIMYWQSLHTLILVTIYELCVVQKTGDLVHVAMVCKGITIVAR